MDQTPVDESADRDEPALGRLLQRLDLAPTEDPLTFLGAAGEGSLNRSGRIFGGSVVAQSVIAAGRALAPRRLHFIQQAFLRGGRPDLELRYRVDVLFEGRTYASARVDVWQGDDLISHATVGVSGHVDGPDRQQPMPPVVPVAATLPRDEVRGVERVEGQPISCRIDPAQETDGTAALDTWMRAAGPVPDEPLLHQALLAYATDRAMISTAWKPHAKLGDVRGSTLNHSIWFHRDHSFDDWHVHAMQSPTLSDGRSLILGAVYSADGTHVASTSQEATLRVRRND